MWHLTGREITVNLADGGPTFTGRVRFSLAWWWCVLDDAYLVQGETRHQVEGRLRIPADRVLFYQLAPRRPREVTA